ncbi:MAG: PglZ domain-containing protein [Chlorobium sp.]|nr:PglZ domain-containing protein [Chlorobium sp.]
MSISLLIDVYSSKRSTDHIYVDDAESYVEASRAIDRALKNSHNLSIVLHNPAQRDWFAPYADRIAISTYDPCREFADTLKVKVSVLPVEIVQDPRFIIFAGLTEKAKLLPPSSAEKVETWILENALNPVWAIEQINTYDQLAAVLTYLIKNQNARIHPTLQTLRNKRVAAWKITSVLHKVVIWLFADDPYKRAENLFYARLIWNYPHEVKLKALKFGSRWQDLSLLEDYQNVIMQLPIQKSRELALPHEMRLVLDEYLTQALENEKLESVISMLSGIAEEELPIKKHLEANFDVIDETWSGTLSELNRLFAYNLQSQSFISYLQTLVPIRKPSVISPIMSWEEVSNWLATEYFPYYSWCAALGKIDHTNPSVSCFEDWLANNYYQLTKTKAFAPYAVQPLIVDNITNTPVLHIIIDCLPWIYAAYLQERLMEKGLDSVETSMHVTTLPTITNVAKPCLIRGQLPAQLPAVLDQQAKTYSELFAQSLRVSIDDILYTNSNETDIESMISSRKKAYLYLDNEIDNLAHKSVNSERRRSLIKSHLDGVVDSIIRARSNHKRFYGSELTVVISSDHGFTELPENNKVLDVPGDDWAVDHNKLLLNATQDNPSPDDYMLISTEMLGGGKKYHYVARGYRTIESRPRGGSHGGITPQEVIVPVVIINSAIDVTFKSLRVAISGEIRRGREHNIITVEIFNSNSFPITIKSLDLRLINVSNPGLLKIMPGETISIPSTIDSSKIKEESISITGAILLTFKGRDITDNFENQVSTVGAAIADQAFEDEFDV